MDDNSPQPSQQHDHVKVSSAVIAPGDRLTDVPQSFQSTYKERRRSFIILLLAMICLGMGQTVLFAVLPPIARVIGMQDWQVGAIFSVSAVCWVLTSPRWGRISDAKGRKPVLLTGLGAFAFSMILLGIVMQFATVTTLSVTLVFALMVASRCIHGSVGSACPPAAQAYIADRTSAKERTATMANFAAAFGLGSTIGPGVGSAASVFGPVAPIYAVAFIAIMAMGAISLFLPERTKPKRSSEDKVVLKMTDPRVKPILIYGVFAGLIYAVPLQVSAFYFIDVLSLSVEESAQFVGVALMLMSFASLFSQLVLVQRFHMSAGHLFCMAPIFLIVGHTIMAFGTTFGVLSFGLLLIGLGSGMFLPALGAGASLAVSEGEQGAAAGYGTSSIGMGLIFTPVLVFSVYNISPNLPFIISIFLSIGLALYALVNPKLRDAGKNVEQTV